MGEWEHQGPDLWQDYRRTTHGLRYLYGYATREQTPGAEQGWAAIIEDEVGGRDAVLGQGLTLEAARAVIAAEAAAD
jgi:hypothetical protein